MKTLVIRVDELDPRLPGYPVSFCLHGVAAGGAGMPVQDVIPPDLSVVDPPENPETQAPFDSEGVLDLVLTRDTPSPAFPAAGRFLFQLLFRDAIRQAWEQIPASERESLLTVLDIRPRKLARLPWELTQWGNPPLFLKTANPWVRGKIDFGQPSAADWWPIRALIVVGCESRDPIAEKAEEEAQAIEAAFRKLRPKIEWELLRCPSRTQLFEELRTFRPHFLHFIGHGRMDDAAGGSLEISSEAETWDWKASEIPTQLQDTAPRFAFLNACQSGEPASREGTWSVTEAFLEAGVAAVVGMQAPIEGHLAAIYAKGLYEALAAGQSLEHSMVQARLAVFNETGATGRQWALASLTLSVPPEQVLAMKPAFRDDIASDTAFQEIFAFVDRAPLRRDLWFGVDPIAQHESPRRLLVVEGQPSVGKSWLVRRCLEGCALRGRQILYVDLKRKSYPFLDVLRLIRDGEPNARWRISRPLDPGAFRRFNRDVNWLVAGRLPPDEDPQEDEPDQAQTWPGGEENLEKRLFRSFRDALQRAAGGEPLILVLDDVELDPGQFGYLLRNLIDPIQQQQVPSVRMILVLSGTSPGQYEKYGLDTLGLRRERISVVPFKRDEFQALAREFCRYHPGIHWPSAEKIIEGMAGLPDPTWCPADLRTLLAALGKSGGGG